MRVMHVSSGRNKKASDTAVSLSVPPTPAVAGATCGGVPSICTRPSLAGTASHLGKITSDVAFFSNGAACFQPLSVNGLATDYRFRAVGDANHTCY